METSKVHKCMWVHLCVCECVRVCMWVCLCVLGTMKKCQRGTAERIYGWSKSTGCGGLQSGDDSKTSPRPTPVWLAKQSYCWSLRQEMVRRKEEALSRACADSKSAQPGAKKEAPVHHLGPLAPCTVESFDEREMDDWNCVLTTLAITWKIRPWEKKVQRGRASNCSHREERVMERQDVVPVSRGANKLLGRYWVGPGTERVQSRYEGRQVKSNIGLLPQPLETSTATS